MAQETKQGELSRVASEAAQRFGVKPVPLKEAIEEELTALVAAEVAFNLYKARGGKQKSRAVWGTRPRRRREDSRNPETS